MQFSCGKDHGYFHERQYNASPVSFVTSVTFFARRPSHRRLAKKPVFPIRGPLTTIASPVALITGVAVNKSPIPLLASIGDLTLVISSQSLPATKTRRGCLGSDEQRKRIYSFRSVVLYSVAFVDSAVASGTHPGIVIFVSIRVMPSLSYHEEYVRRDPSMDHRLL